MTVRHPGRGQAIGNQDGPLRAFHPQEQFSDNRIDVNSVQNNVGAEIVIRKREAENAWITMAQWPHGIERMRGVPRPSRDPCASVFQHRIRMAYRYRHATLRRFADHLQRAVNFWSNGDQLDMAARRLPEAVEYRDRRPNEIFGRMYAPARVAQKRAFQMNSDRLCASLG